MSNTYRQTRIKCGNDCVSTGCPGHDLVLAHHHTSDTVSVLFDNQQRFVFDKDVWKRLVLMENEFDNWQHPMFVEPSHYSMDRQGWTKK